MNLLLVYQADYADEFNVYGLRIVTSEEWKEIKEDVNNIEYPLEELYFGTNEFMDYDSAKELLSGFNAIVLDDSDVKVFTLFMHKTNGGYGSHCFGWDPLHALYDISHAGSTPVLTAN